LYVLLAHLHVCAVSHSCAQVAGDEANGVQRRRIYIYADNTAAPQAHSGSVVLRLRDLTWTTTAQHQGQLTDTHQVQTVLKEYHTV
jgi:hypothetical protein